jgi:hypothetical protein
MARAIVMTAGRIAAGSTEPVAAITEIAAMAVRSAPKMGAATEVAGSGTVRVFVADPSCRTRANRLRRSALEMGECSGSRISRPASTSSWSSGAACASSTSPTPVE